MEGEKNMKQNILLIIGNGFDLKCGLETRYIDYWNYKRNQNERFNELVKFLIDNPFLYFGKDKYSKLENLIDFEDDISFFDLFFTVYDWQHGTIGTDKAWSNIEDVLLSGFSMTNNLLSLTFNNLVGGYMYFLNPRNHSFYAELGLGAKILVKHIRNHFNDGMISDALFQRYIIDELDKFSINFSKFVNKQVEEHPDYIVDAQKLIGKITGVAQNECEIISFNYTEPIVGNNLANIHGVASKEYIVFGTTCGEGKGIETTHNLWNYHATKEYKTTKALANGIKVSANFENIDEIFVYGSSLGKQDYDFYKNLFDRFDFLMRLPIAKIHFCFSQYGDKTLEEVAEETTIKVSGLINSFGDSHNDYGLLRRLIQNGKLDFIPIP